MSTVLHPPIASSAPADDQIVVDGNPVRVLASYPPWGGLQLHSLVTSTSFRCGACARARESSLLALGDGMLICPACFARLTRAGVVDLPEQRHRTER